MPVLTRANEFVLSRRPRRVRPATARTCSAAAVFGLALAAVPASAQCKPPQNSNEAKLLAFYSAPVSFSVDAAPEHVAPWSVRVSLEVEPMPTPNDEIEQTHLCFESKGENTRLSPIFGRPRVTIGLPAGFVFEGSYVPPIHLYDAEPNLGSFALSRVTRLPSAPWGGALSLMVRAHGTVGQVRGPITCPQKGLQTDDEGDPCFGTVPSKDTFHPYMVGGEGAFTLTTRDQRWAFYAGGGVNFLRPRFQTGFTDGNGVTDSTKVEVNLTRGTVFGGVTAHVTHAFELSAQVYSQPADVTTVRFSAGYILR
jgi:hypothetical protein